MLFLHDSLLLWVQSISRQMGIKEFFHPKVFSCCGQGRVGKVRREGSVQRAAAVGVVQCSVQCSQQWSSHTSLGSEGLPVRASF